MFIPSLFHSVATFCRNSCSSFYVCPTNTEKTRQQKRYGDIYLEQMSSLLSPLVFCTGKRYFVSCFIAAKNFNDAVILKIVYLRGTTCKQILCFLLITPISPQTAALLRTLTSSIANRPSCYNLEKK